MPAWLTRPVVILPVIMLAVVALYARSLNDWFQTDDLLLLRAARVVPFWTYVREAFDFTDFEPLHFYAYRPLYFISSDALHAMFGLDPVPYHGAVLALHLINVVLTFHVARKLTGSIWIGYGASAIFGLHPVYYFEVAWISGFNSVAATTGQLACTALLLAYDERRRWYLLAGALAAYALALLFHQEIFVAPAVVLAYIVARQLQWHRSLLTRRVIVPFALFGVVLLTFLLVQGQASQEAGLLDNFQPDSGTLRLTAGTLAISAAPLGGGGFVMPHYLLASAIVAGLALVLWQAKSLRAALLFGIAWYASLLMLSLLFFDQYPESQMQAVIARKLYPAGPAIGLMAAIAAATLWEWSTKHMSASIIAAALGIILVATPPFIVVQAQQQEVRMAREGVETQQFYNALKAAQPNLREEGTLYVAGAPPALLSLCVDPARIYFRKPSTTLCYLDNLAAVIYGRDVPITKITKEQARNPEFLASLGPEDRVFCYRC